MLSPLTAAESSCLAVAVISLDNMVVVCFEITLLNAPEFRKLSNVPGLVAVSISPALQL